MKRSIENLKKVRETLLKEDKDFLMILSGAEGVGKSALALILAMSIDPNFKIENVIYNLSELIDRIKQSKKGDIIIIDEAILNLDKRAALTKENVAIRRIIKTMREFNLLVFVIVPQVDDLEKYIIKHRAKGLIRITKRSRFFCYNQHQLRRIKKSKFSDRLHYPRPSWKESYPSCEKLYPELWKQYKNKKARLLDDDQFLKHVKPQVIPNNPFIYRTIDIARKRGVSVSTVKRKKKDMTIKVDYILLKSGQTKFAESAVSYI